MANMHVERESTAKPIISGSQPTHHPYQQLSHIDMPHENDVLCGRGIQANKHPGNVRFRELVMSKKETYVVGSKKEKMTMSQAIVKTLREDIQPLGRFLTKDPSTGLWFDIGFKRSIEKTAQALRDAAAGLRKKRSHDVVDSGVPLVSVEDKGSHTKDHNQTVGLTKKDVPVGYLVSGILEQSGVRPFEDKLWVASPNFPQIAAGVQTLCDRGQEKVPLSTHVTYGASFCGGLRQSPVRFKSTPETSFGGKASVDNLIFFPYAFNSIRQQKLDNYQNCQENILLGDVGNYLSPILAEDVWYFAQSPRGNANCSAYKANY